MTEEDTPDIGRRTFLTRAAVGGAAVAGGLIGAGATAVAASSPWRRESLVLEVACRGDRWRESVLGNPSDDSDFHRGFTVEGWMYPEGTIPVDGFVPTPDGAIGQWFCRGWQIVDAGRAEPHVNSIQDYLFDLVVPDRLFPRDVMHSNGLEGTEDDQIGYRSITGGTGTYLGASGEVAQRITGVNTSLFADGSGFNAPNFRFEFDILLPNV
jgi:hypothetical protein